MTVGFGEHWSDGGVTNRGLCVGDAVLQGPEVEDCVDRAWRVVLQGKHVYTGEDTVLGQSMQVHVARMRRYPD